MEGARLTGQTPYKVNVKFITQMVPVNLLGAIAATGFDYNMSPKSIADAVVERSQTLWNRNVVLPSAPAVLRLRPTEREIMAPPNKPFLPESKAAATSPQSGGRRALIVRHAHQSNDSNPACFLP